MRTILVLCAAILVAGAAFTWRSARMPDQYGAFTGAPQTDVNELIQRPEDFLGRTVAAVGTVRQQCKVTGCFFFFWSGEKALRVDLERIAVTAPVREGRPVRVEGQIVPYGKGYQLFATAVMFE